MISTLNIFSSTLFYSILRSFVFIFINTWSSSIDTHFLFFYSIFEENKQTKVYQKSKEYSRLNRSDTHSVLYTQITHTIIYHQVIYMPPKLQKRNAIIYPYTSILKFLIVCCRWRHNEDVHVRAASGWPARVPAARRRWRLLVSLWSRSVHHWR